jgi:hypothetical protein
LWRQDKTQFVIKLKNLKMISIFLHYNFLIGISIHSPTYIILCPLSLYLSLTVKALNQSNEECQRLYLHGRSRSTPDAGLR